MEKKTDHKCAQATIINHMMMQLSISGASLIARDENMGAK